MNILIAAEPLENGTGLATFLIDSVSAFAEVQPEWHFTVLALERFSDAADLRHYRNVEVIYCDKLGLRGKITQVVPYFKGRDRILNFLARFSPTAKLKKEFGNIREIWKDLSGFDVLWVPHFSVNHHRWPVLSHPELIRWPVVLTIHDLIPAVFPEYLKGNLKVSYNFWMKFKPFAQKAQSVITHGEFQKQSIVDYFKIVPQKIKVIYLGLGQVLDKNLAVSYTAQEMESLRQQLGVSESYVFSPISQTSPHKNHLRLIEAWSFLAKRFSACCPQLVFTAKGNPRQHKVFKEKIRELGLEDKVIFTGFLSQAEMGMLYQNCKAVVSPSLYEAGGGYLVFEAALVGKPIACSRIPQAVEQLERWQLEVNYFDPLDVNSIAEAILLTLQGISKTNTDTIMKIKSKIAEDHQSFTQEYLTEFARVSKSPTESKEQVL